MEKSDPERIEREKLHLKDAGISEVRVVDSKDLQSKHQLQEGPVHIKGSQSTERLKTQKMMQQEKEQSPSQNVPTQDTLKKFEANELFHQECGGIPEKEQEKMACTNKKKGENAANIEPTDGLETQKAMQQGKPPSPLHVTAQYSRKKSDENESFHQECRELKNDEKSKQLTDVNIMMRQKDDGSLVTALDSNQTNQQEDTIYEECDAFADEDPNLDGNTKASADILGNNVHVLEQESIQITEQDNDALYQKHEKALKKQSVSKLGTNLVVKPKDEALKDYMFVLIQDPAQIAKQDTNNVVQQNSDRIAENSLHLQEVASGSQISTDDHGCLPQLQETASPPESEESHCVPLQTEHNLEEEVDLPFLRRPCHYRLQIPLDPWLPPVPEEDPWHPPVPRRSFETSREDCFEPLAQRIEEVLDSRMLTQQLELLQYAQRIRGLQITPESVASCEEIQRRCVKLFWSLILGGILVVALYFLIDFLEKKYDTGSSNSTHPFSDFGTNLNILRIDLEPDRLETNLDFTITTMAVNSDYISTTATDLNDRISILVADMHNNISTSVVGLNYNVTTLKDSLDNNITFLVVGGNDNATFLVANLDDVTSLTDSLDDNVTSLADGLDSNVTSLTYGLDSNVTSLVDGLDGNVTSLTDGLDSNVTSLTYGLNDNVISLDDGLDDNVISLVTGLNNSVTFLEADLHVDITNSKAEVVPALHDLKVNVSTPEMYLNDNEITFITKFDVKLIN